MLVNNGSAEDVNSIEVLIRGTLHGPGYRGEMCPCKVAYIQSSDDRKLAAFSFSDLYDL
jgi:hypothetical protein